MSKQIKDREERIRYYLDNPEKTYEELSKIFGILPKSVKRFARKYNLPAKEAECPRHPNYQGKSEPKVDCRRCKEIWEKAQMQKENERLQKQLENFTFRHQMTTDRFSGERIRFGYVTDTHLGSYYERLDLLKLAYDCYAEEGIEVVYHSGDILEGEKMYRGQEYEIHVHGADRQVKHCVDNYPKREGIITKFITGNHDLKWWMRSGIDVGELIASQREDMDYLGRESVDIWLENGNGRVKLRLEHPGGGTAYAISYKTQKYIESLTGGEKPNLILIGHFHKAEVLPNYRNVIAIQGGTLQSQTPFMRRKQNAAMLGFWIIELKVYDNSIVECIPQFYPQYEKEK